MKSLFIVIFLLMSIKVFPQGKVKSQKIDDKSFYISDKKFEGVVFGEKYIYLFSENGQKFTPTINDIIIAENVLTQNIENIQDSSNQKIFIRKNLKKYYRQYIGYINDRAEKVIFINFFWKKSVSKRALNEQMHVLDGGNHYWQIKVNISKLGLFDFYANGQS